MTAEVRQSEAVELDTPWELPQGGHSGCTFTLPLLVHLAGLSKEDRHKLDYAVQQLGSSGAVMPEVALEASIVEALQWQSCRSPREVTEQREAVLRQLELASKSMHESGMCAGWLEKCDETTRRVSCDVNGP